jgi:hypothetical protein
MTRINLNKKSQLKNDKVILTNVIKEQNNKNNMDVVIVVEEDGDGDVH